MRIEIEIDDAIFSRIERYAADDDRNPADWVRTQAVSALNLRDIGIGLRHVRPMPPRPPSGMEPPKKPDINIYFIRRGDDGPIKIGSAADVSQRLRQLQCASAEPLHIIKHIKQTIELTELGLHKRFASLRMKGEWFKPERELLEFVECLATSDPDATQPMKRERS